MLIARFSDVSYVSYAPRQSRVYKSLLYDECVLFGAERRDVTRKYSVQLQSTIHELVRDFITTPTAEQERCHAPKPILLDVGEMHYPYEWAPSIVEISIVRIGNFVILAVPGELTTMSGRRLLRAVRDRV